jgi:hypothetical protein
MWTHRLSRCRISLLVNGITVCSPSSVPFFGFQGAGGDQKRGGEHGRRDVGVPGVVAADLVLVQTDNRCVMPRSNQGSVR